MPMRRRGQQCPEEEEAECTEGEDILEPWPVLRSANSHQFQVGLGFSGAEGGKTGIGVGAKKRSFGIGTGILPG